MIIFSEVVVENIESPLDFIIPDGDSAAVITSREIENSALVRILLGFQSAVTGTFTLGGDQPAALNDSEISLYRRKIGVIYHDGGLISNLNLWENLTLQLSFEGVLGRKEIEEMGRSVLEKVGYAGSPSLPVSRLSLFQRRQMAFARAFLIEPSVMIYHSTFEGLSRVEQKQLSILAWDYHNSGEKTSLFLTSYPESLKEMNFNDTYHTGGASSI